VSALLPLLGLSVSLLLLLFYYYYYCFKPSVSIPKGGLKIDENKLKLIIIFLCAQGISDTEGEEKNGQKM